MELVQRGQLNISLCHETIFQELAKLLTTTTALFKLKVDLVKFCLTGLHQCI